MQNVALSVRSDFSIGESLLQVDKIPEQAKEAGWDAVALVDTMSVHGMVNFTNKCKKVGIRPIIGCTLRVYDDPTFRPANKKDKTPNHQVRVKVYVRNEKGMEWLLRTLSRAYTKERHYYNARCGWDDFDDAEGIVITTGDFYGLFSHPEYWKRISSLYDKLGVPLVCEMVAINTPIFQRTNAIAFDCARRLGLGLIITRPVLYKNEAAGASLDALECVIRNNKMSDPWVQRRYVKDLCWRKPAELLLDSARTLNEMDRLNLWVDSAGANASRALQASAFIQNSNAVGDICDFEFKKLPVSLPKMATDEFVELMDQCKKGWEERFSYAVSGYKPDFKNPDVLNAYRERLKTELGVLRKMGFSGYFLLAQHIVRWSKENGIIVGPGRGSVGGSLVAYLLGITDVDPLRFNLLFERFINPERLDLPDADLDFMSSRRHEVIEYLQQKFGQDRVAGISNFSTMASGSAVRDAGRVFGLTPLDLAPIKLVPKEHGQPVTLKEAAEQVPEIEKFKDANPEVWKHAETFEGCMRALGQHAAGVVVAGEPLINRAVVETRNEDGLPVVSWDKATVEDWGLVKLDILGLSTLDVLAVAAQYIEERHGLTTDYLSLELDDPKVMAAFGRGDTTGVFQFSSGGMKELLRNLASTEPLIFDDIAAATALYRPGPMDSGLLDDYVARKTGKEAVTYDHPAMEAALKDTYGVIVYQEQVMKLSIDLAGFTGAESDHLRKAMGKKDKDKMAEMRDKWIKGCEKTVGMPETQSGPLFDKIEKFAGYGFNKSHSIEYSVISYWTMWLRVYFPAEYFAATLMIQNDPDKLKAVVKDARECDIEVMPPDLNKSTDRYVIWDDKTILAPFSALKGVSPKTAQRIVELREAEPLKTFATKEHAKNVFSEKGSKVNSRVVENLEKVGAFCCVDTSAKPVRDFDRRKDQIELLPGLVIDVVKSSKVTDLKEGFIKSKVIRIIQDYKECTGCSLKDKPHPDIRFPAGQVKFMVVTDGPSWQEEKEGKLLVGDAGGALRTAILDAGLSVTNGYYTTLVKARKTDKFYTNEQINGCSSFLEREIELVKPGVIVALGSAAIRYFLPAMKGGVTELGGKGFYDPKRDATIVCGINPAQVAFDTSKIVNLQETFAEVANVIL